MTTCGIYAIYSTLDGECLYVGQSKEIERRFRSHICKLKGKRSQALRPFVEWYHENGACEENLRLETLELCENVDLIKNKLEIKWFNLLNPRFYGKMPSQSEKWSHCENTKAKIAEAIRISHGNVTGTNLTNPPVSRQAWNQIFDSNFKDKAIKLYFDGNSIRATAQILEIPYATLQRAFRRWAVRVKPRTFNGYTHSPETRRRIKASVRKSNLP